MKMRRLLIIFILFTAAWLLGFLAFTYRINHFRPDDGTKTDAIIVLTGGKNRISEAVKLLNDGLGDKLFISGVAKETSLDDLSRRGDLSIQSKREITLDKRSTNTVENAIEAAEWIRQNKIKSIRLVTSNYHILQRAGISGAEKRFENHSPSGLFGERFAAMVEESRQLCPGGFGIQQISGGLDKKQAGLENT